ncbi:hypothetical protein HDU98_009045 [Podochytrium sp. JEL0797]|nr:hypothetical protein HDU98_009045 [Podochytrium sp. JEL0797]
MPPKRPANGINPDPKSKHTRLLLPMNGPFSAGLGTAPIHLRYLDPAGRPYDPTRTIVPTAVQLAKLEDVRQFGREQKEAERKAADDAAAAAVGAPHVEADAVEYDFMDHDDDHGPMSENGDRNSNPPSPRSDASSDVGSDDADSADPVDLIDEPWRFMGIHQLPFVVTPAETLTKYERARRNLMDGFQHIESALVATLSLFITPNLRNEACCHDKCKAVVHARCFSCRSLSLPSTFCLDHAKYHAHKSYCHHVEDSSGTRITTAERIIDCCDAARASSHDFRSMLHSFSSQHVQQCVRVRLCRVHSDSAPITLMREGFMACGVTKPGHAFSISMVHLGLKMRAKGMAYQTIAEVFMDSDTKGARQLNLYTPFMDAIRQYAGLPHRIRHGLLTEETVDQFGSSKTTCPSCMGTCNSTSPFVFTIDGFKSAKHFKHGGGTHGFFKWLASFFSKPGVDHVEAAKQAGRVVPQGASGCGGNFVAGSDAEKVGSKYLDVGMIVHMDCRHDLVLKTFDASTEKMVYADTCVAWARDNFPNRRIVFGYDVVCKWVSHARVYGLGLPYIYFMPAMHVYAHGIDCQCRYGPHVILGLGWSINGEGHERFNAWLSKSIGLTVSETHENRHLDIALVVEDYNITKLKGLVQWTKGVLKTNLKRLRAIAVEFGPATITSRDPYVDVIARNRRTRALVARKVERVINNPTHAEQHESSRVKLSNLVRIIVSMEHKLNLKVGTTIASQMRTSLQAHYETVAHQMREHNGK